MFLKKIGVALVPVAALALAFGPSVASADSGGPVSVISPVAPSVSTIGGVEVAGVQSGAFTLSCIFAAEGLSVQTCVLPAGIGAANPLAAAPGFDGVSVAGVQALPNGAASFTCTFSALPIGPQTCVIGG